MYFRCLHADSQMEWDKNLAYILILSETKHKVYIMVS